MKNTSFTNNLRKSHKEPNKRRKLKIKQTRPRLLFLTISVLFISIFSFTAYNILNRKIQKVKINSDDNISNVDEIKNYTESLVLNRSFLNLNTENISIKISNKYPSIRNVSVYKSLFNGVVVNLEDYEPLVIIQYKNQDGFSQKILTTDLILIDFEPSSKELYTINYFPENCRDISDLQGFEKYIKFIGENLMISSEKIEPCDLKFAKEYITNALEFINRTQEMNLKGEYIMDNFGNFMIKIDNNKFIKTDLKETFFSIDKQLKVLEDALIKHSDFNEIDLGLNYLVIR